MKNAIILIILAFVGAVYYGVIGYYAPILFQNASALTQYIAILLVLTAVAIFAIIKVEAHYEMKGTNKDEIV